jgi:uncharacterized membrane protein YuzA (DUF378 family)
MSSSPPSFLTTDVIIFVIIILILARRTYLMVSGTQYSAPRLFTFAGFYVLIFGLLGAETIDLFYALWGTTALALVVAYAVVPIVAAFLIAPHVQRMVQFEQRPGGAWYYRLSWHIPVLYLALFVVRFGAELAILGPNAFVISFPPPAVPSFLDLVLLFGVDMLFAVSLGLLVGRGIGVYRAHEEMVKKGETPPAPPPSPPLPSS